MERKYLVAMRAGETPVPIPNTMVKTCAADGTMLETAWESRWLPDFKIKQKLYIKKPTLYYYNKANVLFGLIAQPVRAHA